MVCLGKQFRFLTSSALLWGLLVAAATGTLRSDEREVSQRQQHLERELQNAPCARGMVIVQSQYSFDDTYNNLVDAIRNVNPAAIVAEIDHADAAASVGLELAPNRLVVVGNPALGTPILQENALAGLELPQKFLVFQQGEDDDDDVFIGYNPPGYIVARYENTENAQVQLESLQTALANFASAATGVESGSIAQQSISITTFPPPSSRSGGRNGLWTVASRDDFATTRDRLMAALDADGGPSIAFEVDHAANANGAIPGQSYLIAFGNPNLGTPLMQTNPTAGIDLPLKILITESESGEVQATTNKIGFLQRRHNLQSLNVTTFRDALLNFVGIATGQDF
jgi:uncharacterized protein (DUF302 family)